MKTISLAPFVLTLAVAGAQGLPPRPLVPEAALPAIPDRATAWDTGAEGDEQPSDRVAIEHATAALRAPEAVVFDRPRADGPLWALGRSWKGSFDGTRFTFVPFFGSQAPRNFPLALAVAQATVGGAPLALAPAAPVQTGSIVRCDRGALTEVYAASLEAVEQSFVFAKLPGRGAIVVDLAVATELTCEPIPGGLRFGNALGHVDYTKAVAVDAAGARQPLEIAWTGERIRMAIPAEFVERAQLPIVLDPVINGWYGIASGITQLQQGADVASIQSAGKRTLVVWRRQWSLTDQDCFASVFDGALGFVAANLAIDFTSDDWLHVAVAGNNHAQNFLIVAEIRIGLLWFIGGRRVAVAAGAVPSSVFDIEREGVGPLFGNNFHPDVGSDPYPGTSFYCVVWNHRFGTNSHIYYRLVSTGGVLVGAASTILEGSTTEEMNPSISKSCGVTNGLPTEWLVMWESRQFNVPTRVRGRHVNWDGTLPQPAFQIGFLGECTAPSAGSPVDWRDFTGMWRRGWPFAFENTLLAGTQRDIECGMLDVGGGQSSIDLSTAEPGGNAVFDQYGPDVDSDGFRFVVCYTENNGGNLSTFATTVARQNPATPTPFMLHDSRAFLGLGTATGNEAGVRICADKSGGTAGTSRYVATFSEQPSNDIYVVAYGGHSPGSFFSTFPTQCGSLSIAAAGTPALGDTVTFTVGNAPLSGTILGFPGFIPLNVLGCNCVQGVSQGIYLGNPLVWTVPLDTSIVGVTLSVQGWTIAGTNCLGFVDLSDTIDFVIR